jgi:hypothetical protein
MFYLRYCFPALTLAFIACGSSNNSSSSTNSNSPITVALTPSSANVPAGWTTQFTATVTGANSSVTWSVDGVAGGNSTVGTISTAGKYTAPAQTGSHTVTASSVVQTTANATATVKVVSGIAISPTSADLSPGQVQQFTAASSIPNNSEVNWSVDGVAGGNSTAGTISSTGLYTAPASPGAHTVSATSTVDSSSNATASVAVFTLSVSPPSATLASAATQQFAADFQGLSNGTVTWSVNTIPGGNSTVGVITSAGLYTAPSSAGSYTITATTTADTSAIASATATVFAFGVSPSGAAINPSATQQFNVTAQGISTSVTWAVDGIANGNSSFGTIDSHGLYTAPFAVGGHTITATSTVDPSLVASSSLAVMNYIPDAVLTYHNDDTRGGAYLDESTLTPTNVNSVQFGKLLAYPVDGQIYGQPLYFPQMSIAGAKHDVIFVATENNSLYALDADATSTNPTTFWHANFGPPFPVQLQYGVNPEVGILSTPVIDGPAQVIYAVAVIDQGGVPTFYLHALNASTGAEISGSPVLVTANYSGDTMGSNCYQRMGLALDPMTNWVLLAFGACEHGWLLAYDKASLAQQAVFDDTNGGSGGGLWASGGAPAIDDTTGELYLMSGVDAGDQEWITGNTMVGYNDSFLRLDPRKLSVLDYFAPDDNYALASTDADLGSGANILVPGSSSYPHEVVGGGKDGNIFVINRDSMGGFNDSTNNVLQTVHTGVSQYDNIFSTPAYWNGSLYIHCTNDVLRAFSWSASGNAGQQLSSSPTSVGSAIFATHGATPSVSANGAVNGIVWDIDNSAYIGTDPAGSGPAVLHAYDATNVANELYNSSQEGTRDTAGLALKFTVPTIANGRVFVPTASELDIYGLLP